MSLNDFAVIPRSAAYWLNDNGDAYVMVGPDGVAITRTSDRSFTLLTHDEARRLALVIENAHPKADPEPTPEDGERNADAFARGGSDAASECARCAWDRLVGTRLPTSQEWMDRDGLGEHTCDQSMFGAPDRQRHVIPAMLVVVGDEIEAGSERRRVVEVEHVPDLGGGVHAHIRYDGAREAQDLLGAALVAVWR